MKIAIELISGNVASILSDYDGVVDFVIFEDVDPNNMRPDDLDKVDSIMKGVSNVLYVGKNRSRTISGKIFRIRTPYGGHLVEIPYNCDVMEELAKHCARFEMAGHHITSVTQLFDSSTETPRIPVLTSKEYREELRRLQKEK